jgi:hypothetical protein
MPTIITVNTNPVANHYVSNKAGEKIIEFSSPNGGGLIGFRVMNDGALTVDIYRTDPTVIVRTGEDVRTRQSRKVADALARVIGAQAEARSHMPNGKLGDFPLPAELAALRDLADVVRAGEAASS